MSSAGQIVGGVIGGAIGFMAGGNVMLGVSIGASIGGYIDPPKGQNTVGPRLEDLTVQTSTYGAEIPRIKGTVAVTGNVFWLEGDQIKEHSKTKKVGGKGGPTAKQTTYSYTATFAVSLAQCITGPVAGIRRLWLANTLVYDAGSDNLQSIIASNLQDGVTFKVYDGRDDQSPDPRMQADKGVANVSGYPGRVSIFFYDLDLTAHYSNTLMATQAKVELVGPGMAGVDCDPAEVVIGGMTSDRGVQSCVFNPAGADYVQRDEDGWTKIPQNLDYCTLRLGDYQRISSSLNIAADFGAFSTYAIYPVMVASSDRRVAIMQLVRPHPDNFESRIWLYSPTGNWQSLAIPAATLDIADAKFASVEGAETFIHQAGSGGKVHRFSGSQIIASSAGTYNARASSLSENYLFLLAYSASSSTTTIYRLNRSDLSLNATWTGAGYSSNGALHVVDDETVYVAVGLSGATGGGHVYQWVSGVLVADLGALVPATFSSNTSTLAGWFEVFSVSPPHVLSLSNHADTNYAVHIGHQVITTNVAKLHDIIIDECALVGVSSGDLDLSGLTDHDVRGYRHSGGVRAALEQLQAAFPFDVLQSGYKIKFKDRGGAAVLTVPESDLGAHTGNDMPVRFSTLLEMPTQVPAKVTFNFLNADREYDPDEQSSAFTAQDVKNSYTVSLPLVMTANEAKQAADVLLKKEQIERTSVAPFWLPPTDNYRKLEAADVIDVIAKTRTHTVRITKVTNLPDGRVECEGKLTASVAYTSTAQAQESLAIGQSLVPLAGSSEAIILDIPRIVADQDVPGVSAAMFGYTADWPGGVLFRSDDSGQSYAAATAFQTKTEVFTAVDAIGAGSPYAVDHVSTLTVTPDFSGADLFSITETQLYAHGNLAAYGADGRWEIVAFKTAVDNSGSYTLRDFRRGLYGTEQYSGTHAAGDKLVMLDLDGADFVGLPLTAINSPRLWRGVTAGAAIDSVSDIAHTYGAVNLKPLAPVHLNGERDAATRNWKIRFSPRTRWPVELFSGLSVPLGETSPMYEVEVWNSTYTLLKRTISGLTTNEADYAAAQQVEDFGAEQDTLYLKVYQLSSVVGRGFPLVASIYRNVSEDPYIGSVKLLMHMDDAGLTDQCGHAVTLYGGAARSSTQSRHGGYSAYIDGAGDYLTLADSADWVLGSSDWTLEVSFYEETSGVIRQIIGQHSTHSNSESSFIVLSNSQKVELSVFVGGAITTIASASTHTLNAWHDLSAERHGNTIYLYLDGSLVASSATLGSSAMNNSNQPMTIGVVMNNGSPDPGGYYFKGFIDEVRFTPGISRRGGAGSYTVPSAAFPNP